MRENIAEIQEILVMRIALNSDILSHLDFQ